MSLTVTYDVEIPGQPLIIGIHAIVGMVAVVAKDVQAGPVDTGNSMKPLLKS
jgi:hypothetical protein